MKKAVEFYKEYKEGNVNTSKLQFEKAMVKFAKMHVKEIREAYDQYTFFLDGYRNGSASISEVNHAHSEFTKLLDENNIK